MYWRNSGSSAGVGMPASYTPSVCGRSTTSDASVRPTVYTSEAIDGPCDATSGAWNPLVP